MNKTLNTFFTVLITTIVTFSLTVFLLGNRFAPQSSVYPDQLSEIRSYIDRYSVKDFSEEMAEYGAAHGYLYGLDDDYSVFWSQEEYEARQSSTEGNFSGIGVSLRSDDPISEGMFVYRVYGNSPAETAGMKAGDLIVEVNGSSVIGRAYQEVFDSFAENPDNVNVVAIRNGERLTFHMTFEDFIRRFVDYRMIDEVAYIRIYEFWDLAVLEFRDALSALMAQNPKALILDVRNNLGGSVNSVVSILEPLIPAGEECVVQKYKNDEKIIYSTEPQLLQIPVTVLINNQSASASELLASCLRDVCDAHLVGTRSIGKGVGQTVFNLSDGSALKITTFYCMTKSRTNYDEVGLEPDLTVALDEEQTYYFYSLDESNDPQLQAALSDVRSRIES